MNLFDELAALLAALNREKLPYALCGGLAMAVHALPRATMDIDLLVPPDEVDRVLDQAKQLGFRLKNPPMEFKRGAVKIERVVKTDPVGGDFLPLDLLVVTPALAEVWNGREWVETEFGPVCVVNRAGLIALKRLRLSGQDRDDIKRLRGTPDET